MLELARPLGRFEPLGLVPERRAELDQWFTDARLAAWIVKWAGLRPGDHVIEPSAGTGRFIQALPDYVTWDAVELDEALIPSLMRFKRDGCEVHHADFWTWAQTQPQPFRHTVGIMNPPYKLDTEFGALMGQLCDRVIALVRNSYMHGTERYERIWSRYEPTRQVVFIDRPDFDEWEVGEGGARHDFILVEYSQRF